MGILWEVFTSGALWSREGVTALPPRPDATMIFISHDHDDYDISNALEKLIRRFQGPHYGVFNSSTHHSIKADAQWRDAVVSTLNKCAAVVFILSPRSLKSAEVARELQLAELSKKPVLTMLLDIEPKDVPETYRNRQLSPLDTSGGVSAMLQRFVDCGTKRQGYNFGIRQVCHPAQC